MTPLNGLSFRQAPIPELPNDKWVRVKTLMAGICGTDLGLLAQRQPPDSILQAYSSFPAILGHENLGIVEHVGAAVDKSWLGKRVCVDPTLCCQVRGIDPPCDRCDAGLYGACENFGQDGTGTAKLPPGVSLGYNSATGGSFSEYYLAHESQLMPVPDELIDEQAILTDPIGCGLHAVLRIKLEGVRSVLVYGAGVLGLAVISSLRAVGYTGRIDALDNAAYLSTPASSLGANCFLSLPPGRADRFEAIAERTGGVVKRARFGNYTISGGYDAIFDCVGSQGSINESLKWTRPRGQVVIIGTGSGGRLDLTPLWFTELTVMGAYGRQIEQFDRRSISTYRLVHELMVSGRMKLDGLLTHTFELADYRRAFDVGLHKGRHQAIKVAFDLRSL